MVLPKGPIRPGQPKKQELTVLDVAPVAGTTTGEAAYAVVLGDKETWLGTKLDGSPSTYSRGKIIAALEDEGWSPDGGGAVDSVNGQTGAVVLDAADVGALEATDPRAGIVSLTSGWEPYRDHPTATKPLDAPVLAFADQSAASMYWPTLVDLRPIGQAGVALLYSTDHGAGGIYMASADDPLGPYTDDGLIYAGGTSAETPSVIWNETTGLYHLYTHRGSGLTNGGQATYLATTDDFATFTDLGVVLDNDVDTSGDHTGYFTPFRIDGAWHGWSLWIGGASSTWAYWESADGIAWTKQSELSWELDHIDHLTGATATWRYRWGGEPIRWRGETWVIAGAGENSSGGTVTAIVPTAAKLTASLDALAEDAVELTLPAQAWEMSSISQVGRGVVWHDRLFVPYRAGDDNSTDAAFGILEVI